MPARRGVAGGATDGQRHRVELDDADVVRRQVLVVQYVGEQVHPARL
jgi:hypothetical protein